MDLRSATDVTLPLRRGMPLYPGDHAPRLRRLASLDAGDSLTTSELTINCHVGTHADAPAHFRPDGATIDRLPRKHVFGEACVIDLSHVEHVTDAAMRGVEIDRNRHIILKTRNAPLLKRPSFTADYCHVHAEAIARILDCRPLSIGIDYYSLDPVADDTFPAHRLVAQAGLPVFVCLDLMKVSAGPHEFAAFGAPLVGAEAVQVRAFLHRQGDGQA